MTSHEQTVREFLETWERRKAGILPMPDMRVSCSKCGVEIKGDSRVEFIPEGLVCVCCFERKAKGA